MARRHTEYYEFMGIAPDAGDDEIRRAYKKKSLEYHPDRNPDKADLFKKLQHVYDILKDETKREVYDKYGPKGIEEGRHESRGSSLFDILSGRGGSGGGGRPGERKGEDFVKKIGIELPHLYKGVSKQLRITKRIICAGCSGSGAKAGSQARKCQACGGKGQQLKVIQNGFMIQQAIVNCSDCRGQGEVIGTPCSECSGQKTMQGQKTITINVDPGMQQDMKVVLREEADQEPGVTPGDLVFVIVEMDHPVFKRHGHNLVVKKKITLREALTGLAFTLKHLDDRTLVVRTAPGEFVRPGLSKCIKGEGMPRFRNIMNKGDLFIEFDIEYPAPGALTSDSLTQLRALLPGPEPPKMPEASDDVWDVDMTDVHVSREEALKKEEKRQGGGEAYEEDDDEEGGHPGMGQGVRCAHQ